MEFSEVLKNRIEELVSKKEELRLRLSNPDFHVKRVSNEIKNVAEQFKNLEMSSDQLKEETISVLNQIPEFIASAWAITNNNINILEVEILRWKEMLSLYENWEDEQIKKDLESEDKNKRDEELKKAISEGAIKEPSKMQAIRRRPGQKPEVTLSRYRNLVSELKTPKQPSE
jgi:hypothetical protein